MNVQKLLILVGAPAAAAVISGCAMCSQPVPNDPSCIENSHYTDTKVLPKAHCFQAPIVESSSQVFRPVFRPGKERLTSVGVGYNDEEALHDAVANFLAEHKCDYVVAVSTSIRRRKHPTWRFFSTTNCKLTLIGIPIYLDHLEIRELTSEEKLAAGASTVALTSSATSSTTTTTVDSKSQPAALLKLSNIQVSISATGSTDAKAGVVFPVENAKCTKTVTKTEAKTTSTTGTVTTTVAK